MRVLRYETGLGVALVIVLVVAYVSVKGILGWWSCHAKWAGSGLASSWGPIQGCVVQMPSGKWMPEGNVRDMDLGRPVHENIPGK
jgi:hypothetical protein